MAVSKNKKKKSSKNIDSIELEYSSDLVKKLKNLAAIATNESLSEILSIFKLANSKVIAQDVKKLIDNLKDGEKSFEEFSKQISNIRKTGINKNLDILNKLYKQERISNKNNNLYNDLVKIQEDSYKKIQSHQELITRIKSEENTLYERFFKNDKKIRDQIQENIDNHIDNLEKQNKSLEDKQKKIKKELKNNVKFLAQLDELRSGAEALAESPFKDILSMAETFIERGDDYAKDISDYIKLSIKQPFKEIGLTFKAIPQMFKLGKSVFKNLFKRSPKKEEKEIQAMAQEEIEVSEAQQKESTKSQTVPYEIINSLPDNRRLLQTSMTNIEADSYSRPHLPGPTSSALDKQIKPASLVIPQSKLLEEQSNRTTDFKQDDTEIIKLQQEDVYYKEKAISDNDKNFKTIISLLMINNDLQKRDIEKSKIAETDGMMSGFVSLFKNLFSIKIMDNLFRKFGGTKLAKGLSKLITPLNTKLRKSSFGQKLLRETKIGKQLRKLEAAPAYNRFGPSAMRGSSATNIAKISKTGISSVSKNLSTVMKGLKAGAPALKGLGRSIPLIGTALAVAPDAAEAISALKKGNIKKASSATGSATGGLLGATVGLKAGAAIGTFAGPVGTVIGGALGAAIGGVAGSKLGKVLGKSIYSISKTALGLGKKAFKGIKSVGSKALSIGKKALGYTTLGLGKKAFKGIKSVGSKALSIGKTGIKSVGSKALSIGKKALGYTALGLGKKAFDKFITVKDKIPNIIKNKAKAVKNLITNKKDNIIKKVNANKTTTDKNPDKDNLEQQIDFKKLLEVLKKIEYNTGNIRSQIIQTSIANYENF